MAFDSQRQRLSVCISARNEPLIFKRSLAILNRELAERSCFAFIDYYLVRSKLDYGCIVYGSACKSYLRMLDSVHNQGIGLCLGAIRTSLIENLYIDVDGRCLGARHAKPSLLQYASKIKSLPFTIYEA